MVVEVANLDGMIAALAVVSDIFLFLVIGADVTRGAIRGLSAALGFAFARQVASITHAVVARVDELLAHECGARLGRFDPLRYVHVLRWRWCG